MIAGEEVVSEWRLWKMRDNVNLKGRLMAALSPDPGSLCITKVPNGEVNFLCSDRHLQLPIVTVPTILKV